MRCDVYLSHFLGMSFQATLAQIVEILDATLVNCDSIAPNQLVQRIHTDTRTLHPKDVFLAFRGEHFNGHKFIAQAFESGAIAVIVDQPISHAGPQLVVKDTLVAYQALGQWWRQQFKIPIIAITGSVGKTTTKELISAVLGTAGLVLKTEANFNNEVGVPKTLMGLSQEHQFAVIEMGMRGPGEIACLAKIAQPDIAVITNVGTAHIGRLGSREAIAQAKCELLAELPPESLAILNAETPLLLSTAQRVWSGKTLTYGLHAGDFRGIVHDDGTLEVQGDSFSLPLPGEHNALNYLAALAIAHHLNLDLSPLKQGIQVILPGGRAQRHELPHDVVVLDESYNAGLESMTAALKLLRQTDGKRHIAVLGPMKELGEHALALHQEVGALVTELELDHLLILDPGQDGEGSAIAQGAKPMASQQFSDHQSLIDYLKEHQKPGDRILFKASHSVGLDQVVAGLLSS